YSSSGEFILTDYQSFKIRRSHFRLKGRPRGTWRLKTSAEIVQKAADRMEKVRRFGSCHKIGHNRRRCPGLLREWSQATGTKERVHVTDNNEAMAEEDDVDDGDERDADFESGFV
ncbi:hypothetical protein V1515DRAFT_609608, partial [Lipomyces mesembrius]